MITADLLAEAITRETNHPVWGGMFLRVIAGRLTALDIYAAMEMGGPRPAWVQTLAEGSPEFPDFAAGYAFQVFIGTLMGKHGALEGAMAAVARRRAGGPDLIPHTN
jgi:hypothetical protein